MSRNDFNSSINGDDSSQNSESSPLAPLPADWFRKDKQELLHVLEQLSRGDLITTLVTLLEQAPLPGQTRRLEDLAGHTASISDASTPQTIDLGPEYNTRQLAQLCKISRQAIVERVHRLVELGWLEERCTRRWSFDDEERTIVVANPRVRGPLKKYSA